MLNRRFQLLLEKDMWNKIVKYAKSQNISAGEYIRRVVIRYLEEEKVSTNQGPKMPFKGLFKSKT